MNFLKKISDIKIIALIFCPLCLVYVYLLSHLGQPPSPIYGGDIYYHFGMVNHILEGGDWLADPIFKGELQYYSFFPIFWAFLYKIVEFFGISTLNFFIYSPIILLFFSTWSSYYLGKYFLKSKLFGFFFSLSWVLVFSTFFIMHPRPVAALVIFPFFLYNFFKFEDSSTTKNKALFGLGYGLLAITHLFAFISATLFLFSYYLIKLFRKKFNLSFIEKKLKQLIIPVFLAGSFLSTILGPLIYRYQLKQKNPVPIYSTPKPTLEYFFITLLNLVVNTATLYIFPFLLMAAIGVFCLFQEELKYKDLVLALIISLFIGGFHFIVTKPLFSWYWVYWQFPFYFVFIISILLVFIGIKKIYPNLKDTFSKQIVSLCLLFIIVFGGSFKLYSNFTGQYLGILNYSPLDFNYKWVKTAKSNNLNNLERVEDWIKKNTVVQDVFLSNNSLSFSVNALTGRKVVTTRRTHANPYVDINEREADAAVMLYGQRKEVIKDLLDKYDVKYFYYHPKWGLAENRNPFLVTDKYKHYLINNKVNFKKVTKKLDPAKEGVPKYNRLRVIPISRSSVKQNPVMNYFKPVYKQENIIIYKRIK